MALDTQGGLNTLATSNQPQVLDESAMVEEQATPKTKVLGTDLLDDSVVNLEQQKARLNQQLQKMIDSYGSRTAPSVDPQLAALSEGLGSDTPYFSVAFGKGIGSMAKAATEEERQRREDAKLRLEMMQTGVGLQEKQLAQDLLGRLYKTNEKGELTSEIDPAVASKLSRITGDPKYQQMVISDLQTKRTRESFNKIFPTKEIELPDGTTKSVINFNPAALGDVVKSSSDPAKTLADLTDTIKKMRQSGLLGDQSTRDTPFDAISLFSTDNPEIQKQAKYYAEKYKQGLITDEQADKYANSLMQLFEQTNLKNLSRADANVFKQLNLNLKSDLMNFQIQGKKAEKSKEVTNSLANLDLVTDQVAHIKDHVGRFNGLAVGTLTSRLPFMSTDAKDYVNAVETLKSQAFLNQVSQMRGMGALSDREGKQVQQALANLNIEQSKKEFDRNLNMIISIMSQAKERQLRLAKGYGLTSEDLGGASLPAETTPKETETKGTASTSNVIHYDAQGRRVP